MNRIRWLALATLFVVWLVALGLARTSGYYRGVADQHQSHQEQQKQRMQQIRERMQQGMGNGFPDRFR